MSESSVSHSATYGSVTFIHKNFQHDDIETSPQLRHWEDIDGTSNPKPTLNWLFEVENVRRACLGIMTIVIFGFGMCISMFAPFFPTEAEQRGVSPTMVGIIFSSYSFFLMVGIPLSTGVMKHLGRLFMIFAGVVLVGGSTLLFGFLEYCPPGSAYVALCVILRLTQGAGASLYVIAAFSTGSMFYKDDIAFSYAVMETGHNMGRTAGPSLGGVLYDLGGFPLPFISVGIVLIIIGGLSVVVLHKATFILPELQESGSENNEKPGTIGALEKKRIEAIPSLPWYHYFKHLTAWLLTLSNGISSFVFSFCEPTLSPRLYELGLDNATMVGLVFLSGSITVCVLQLFSGKAADKWPKATIWIMVGGSFVVVVAFFFIGPSPVIQSVLQPSIGLTAASYVILYSGHPLLNGPLPKAFHDDILDAGFAEGYETNGFVAALYNGVWYGGGCFGPIVAGILVESLGFSAGSSIMSGLSVILLAVNITSALLKKHGTAKPSRLPLLNQHTKRQLSQPFDSGTVSIIVPRQ